ncbi:hypothetical protein NDR89_23170 [Cupriavidus gilardii]|uniref:Uncharacterized protein n=1 Tax=Cupriavidus gilardii TaxID=82541 RepID=A0ABY4VQG0_9BURK|nr:hypothetical protein [Cupriavidus gilardii]USE79495.1 hypothetical protein NDR89_23170 [Cupriavidus gilardii]
MAKKWPEGVAMAEVPIYGQRVWLVFDRETDREVRDFFGVEPAAESVAGHAGVFTQRDSGRAEFVLAAFASKDSADWVCTASHECVHMAYYVLDCVGVEHDAGNHEAFAYLQGWLLGEVMAAYAKWRKKKRVK